MRASLLIVIAMVIVSLPACSATNPTQPPAAEPTQTAGPVAPSPDGSVEPSPAHSPSPFSKSPGVNPTSKPASVPADMVRGVPDPDLIVDIYRPDKVWTGTTLIPLNYDKQKPRFVEVNMLGEVVWEYLVPERDVVLVECELLANDNILYTVDGKGVYEIDRTGKVVWQYLTAKVDHDADRLANGNTIFVFGMGDQKTDAQATEVNPKGEIVWRWFARDDFDKLPYNSSEIGGGFAHTNAISRLDNGNTLISPRNFQCLVEVDSKGKTVRTIGEGILSNPHDPVLLENDNVLVANPTGPESSRIVELNQKGEIIWNYQWPDKATDDRNRPTRDCNRLQNGNTLITGSAEIIEVTPQGETVWRLKLSDAITAKRASDPQNVPGFYKADRVSAQK